MDYCKRQVERFKETKNKIIDNITYTERTKEWYIDYHWDVQKDDRLFGKSYEWIIRIEEVDLIGESVPDEMTPELERRCKYLEIQNNDLRDENSKLSSKIEQVKPYLSFYDGGAYDSFDHILDNVHKAQAILRDPLYKST